jgi:hypothetical protein
VELMPLGYPVTQAVEEKNRLSFSKIVKYDHW